MLISLGETVKCSVSKISSRKSGSSAEEDERHRRHRWLPPTLDDKRVERWEGREREREREEKEVSVFRDRVRVSVCPCFGIRVCIPP